MIQAMMKHHSSLLTHKMQHMYIDVSHSNYDEVMSIASQGWCNISESFENVAEFERWN